MVRDFPSRLLPLYAVVDCLAKDRDAMVDIVQARQRLVSSIGVAKLPYCFFNPLKRAAQALAAVSYDAVLIASELVDRLFGQNKRDLFSLDHLLKGGKRGLVTVVLGHIEPDTSIE